MGIGSIAGALFHVVGPELASLAVDAIISRKSRKAGAKEGDVEAPVPEAPGEELATSALLVRQLEEQRASEAALAERLSQAESDLAATRAALGRVEARLRVAMGVAAASALAAMAAFAVAIAG